MNEDAFITLYKKSMVALENQNYTEAQHYAFQALDIELSLPKLEQNFSNQARAHYLIAVSQESLEQDASIQHYNKAINLDPLLIDCYHARGQSYLRMQEYELAIQDFTHYINHNNQAFETFHKRGVTYAAQNLFDNALQDFNTAIILNAEYIPAYNSRALLYIHQERYENALLDFNKAIQLSSADEELLSSRGITYYHLNDYENALQDFNKALQINKTNEDARLYRGLIYYDMNQLNEALFDLTYMYDNHPPIYEAYSALGLIYSSQKNYTESIKIYNTMISLFPHEHSSYLNRAMTCLHYSDELFTIYKDNPTQKLYEQINRLYNQALHDYQRSIHYNQDYSFLLLNNQFTIERKKNILDKYHTEYTDAKEQLTIQKNQLTIQEQYIAQQGQSIASITKQQKNHLYKTIIGLFCFSVCIISMFTISVLLYITPILESFSEVLPLLISNSIISYALYKLSMYELHLYNKKQDLINFLYIIQNFAVNRLDIENNEDDKKLFISLLHDIYSHL